VNETVFDFELGGSKAVTPLGASAASSSSSASASASVFAQPAAAGSVAAGAGAAAAAAPSSTAKAASARDDERLQRGDLVEGRFGGGREWFSGQVERVNGDGTVDLLYDDGDREAAVPVARVRRREAGAEGAGAGGGLTRSDEEIESDAGSAPVIVAGYAAGNAGNAAAGAGNAGNAAAGNAANAANAAAAAAPSAGSGSAQPRFAVGDKVKAQFGGGVHWFEGEIVGANYDSNTYDIGASRRCWRPAVGRESGK
jgi:hypothetical protein